MKIIVKEKFSKRRISNAIGIGKKRVSKFKEDGFMGSADFLQSKDDLSKQHTLERYKEQVENPPDELTENLNGLTYFMDENSFYFVFIPHKSHQDEICVFKLYKEKLYVAQMSIYFLEKWKTQTTKRPIVRSSSFVDVKTLQKHTMNRRSQSLTMEKQVKHMEDLFYSLEFDEVGPIKNTKVIDMSEENGTSCFLLTNKNYIFYLQALNQFTKRKFYNLIKFYSNLAFKRPLIVVGQHKLNKNNSITTVVEQSKLILSEIQTQFTQIHQNITIHGAEISKLKALVLKYNKYESYLSSKCLEYIDKIIVDIAPSIQESDAILLEIKSALKEVDDFTVSRRNDVDIRMKTSLTKLSKFRSYLKSINDNQDKYRRRAMFASFLFGIIISFMALFLVYSK